MKMMFCNQMGLSCRNLYRKGKYSRNSFTSSSWTFTINPAPEAPGYTTQTTIYVPWSCKKINDITNSLPTNWTWSSNVDLNQDLQVGKPITATAIYKGNE